jgi:hypothetical protein
METKPTMEPSGSPVPAVIAGGAAGEVRPDPAIAVAARAASDARLDADRWANDGGSFVAEAAAQVR